MLPPRFFHDQGGRQARARLRWCRLQQLFHAKGHLGSTCARGALAEVGRSTVRGVQGETRGRTSNSPLLCCSSGYLQYLVKGSFSPTTISAISDAIRWANQTMMIEIDKLWPT